MMCRKIYSAPWKKGICSHTMKGRANLYQISWNQYESSRRLSYQTLTKWMGAYTTQYVSHCESFWPPPIGLPAGFLLSSLFSFSLSPSGGTSATTFFAICSKEASVGQLSPTKVVPMYVLQNGMKKKKRHAINARLTTDPRIICRETRFRIELETRWMRGSNWGLRRYSERTWQPPSPGRYSQTYTEPWIAYHNQSSSKRISSKRIVMNEYTA
mmetsp:Transcript_5839/g.11585  ORF Transcript_5839/g.11585 Transcript_5839/m.11585 type:complete len:213 (+) Transcript_5839:438-1076(+)